MLLCIGSRPFMDPTRQPKRVRMSSSKHKAGGSSKAPAHQRGAAYKVPGYMVTDHQLSVPLDHNAHAGTSDTIQLFAREVVAPNKLQQQQPYLVYLQGALRGGEWGDDWGVRVGLWTEDDSSGVEGGMCGGRGGTWVVGLGCTGCGGVVGVGVCREGNTNSARMGLMGMMQLVLLWKMELGRGLNVMGKGLSVD